MDDDGASRRLLAYYLKRAGYEVITASSATEALELLLADGPRIVITDWVMPGMDGEALCRAIRGHEGIPFTFIIIMTAQERTEEYVIRALDAGADDFVSKPVNERELLARLRSGERFLRLQSDLDRRNRDVHRSNAEMAVAFEQLGQLNEKLKKIATTDELTGLTNRRAAIEMLDEQWAAAQRHGWPLSVVVFDIDFFKSFNDAYGHATGDLVLREVAAVAQRNTRREERCCRIGGEEFLIVCPNATEEMAVVGAERIRRAIFAQVVQHEGLKLNVSISLGVAELSPHMEGPDALLHAADLALYAAKDAGRNRVCRASRAAHDGGDADANLPRYGIRLPASLCDSSAEAHVLVVDDDEPTRQLLRRMLELQGYRVSEAEDGLAALEQALAGRPDVVLMDIKMPRMGGVEAIQRLKAEAPTSGIPVIVVCARGDGADMSAGLDAGADEFLTKPVNQRELAMRVRTMIRLRRELNYSNEMRGEQSRVLGILLDFSHRIAECETLDSLLDGTAATLRELTCCREVHLFLPEGHSRELVHVSGPWLEDAADSRKAESICLRLAQRVFDDGEKIVAGPVASTTAADSPDAPHAEACPYLCAPLWASEHCVGAVWISDSHRAAAFSPLELEYVDLITNMATAAIHDFLTRRARDDARDSIVVALAKLAESRDVDTGRHLERVTRFCRTLAEHLRKRQGAASAINDHFLYALERAVPLHDIGKVAVPDRILSKPGPLRPDEVTIMRTHTTIGAATLHSVSARAPGADFLLMAEEIAHAHHEWYDGQGYPRGLRSEEIPLAARIVAVADVYDALTTRRVYKEAMTHEQAVRVIRAGRGTQFDPMVVAAFDDCVEEIHRLARELADESSLAGDRREPRPAATPPAAAPA